MLVWINNSNFILIYFLLMPILGLILLVLTAICESEFVIKLTICYIFIFQAFKGFIMTFSKIRY